MIEKEERPDFQIRHIWYKISRLYNQRAMEHGITMSIGFILFLIEDEGTPSTYLGPRMGMEPTSLSRTLKKMEDTQLIIRKPDIKDGRMVRVYLTKEGTEKRNIARKIVHEFNAKIHQAVPPRKMSTFLSVMSTIDDLLDYEFTFNTKEQ